MYVVCFYWVGDRWTNIQGPSELYGNLINRVGTVDPALASRYINNLHDGVSRFADRPYKFVCFTNETNLMLNNGIEVRNLPFLTKKGVLPRMYMFSKESGLFGHQVLSLDLDIVIVNNLRPLMDYSGMFCTRTKFKPGEGNKLDGDIISFKACEENEERFWNPFKTNIQMVESISNGRERYWIRYVASDIADTWSQVAPNKVQSYKWGFRFKRLDSLKEACIISCHGAPRPHQIKEHWIKEYWK